VRLNVGLRFYADGWGDDVFERLEARAAGLTSFDPPAVEWLGPPVEGRHGWRRRGRFPTPFPHDLLPPASHHAYFEMAMPHGDGSSTPVCVHLGGVGDEGFRLRYLVAGPLVRQGMGAVLLENPLYGLRRPPNQKSIAVRRVSDQFVMNMATMEEACALLAWLRSRGHGKIGITGYSMGGYVAALAGVFFPEDIAVTPCATGISPASVFTEGLLSRYVDWPRLAADTGDVPAAKRRLAELLERAALRRLGPPRRPDAAILVAAERDGYIDPHSVHALRDHWPGSTLRWVDSGHISTFLLQRRALADGVAASFAALGA
jgi:dienelactone hydrolase